MLSGDPEPEPHLALLMEQKRNSPGLTNEVVSEASRWLKAELKGAEVPFTYLSCDSTANYGYSVFIIHHVSAREQSFLEIKVAEINGSPYAFCKVKVKSVHPGDGNDYEVFPYFTEIKSEQGQSRVLALMADFILSTRGETPEL